MIIPLLECNKVWSEGQRGREMFLPRMRPDIVLNYAANKLTLCTKYLNAEPWHEARLKG